MMPSAVKDATAQSRGTSPSLVLTVFSTVFSEIKLQDVRNHEHAGL
jgi:hypothetical protein